MPFNALAFVAGQAIAQRFVDRSRATQLALLPAVLDLPLATALVFTQLIARREAPVAIGAPLVAVPNAVGEFTGDAVALLAGSGLQSQNVPTSQFAADTVVCQSPPAGEQVPAGSTVTLVHNPQVVP